MKKTITTPLPKIFAQAFIYMKSRGAAQNVVELVSKDQLEDFIGNTSGYMFKIFKPMPWPNMTPNQGRGFFGEEIIKTINLINSQKLGQYLEQTPFGTHPSSSKGPDITSTASIYLGPSSDQESLEIGLKTISIESKVRSKTLSGGSSGSLDKLVGENQWVKESKNGKGKFLEQSTIDQSETASNVLSQGKYEITMKTIETKAVGFAPKIIESNTEGQMNTDTQEFYILTPSTVNALIKAFSDPTNSPHAQVEQIENE